MHQQGAYVSDHYFTAYGPTDDPAYRSPGQFHMVIDGTGVPTGLLDWESGVFVPMAQVRVASGWNAGPSDQACWRPL